MIHWTGNLYTRLHTTSILQSNRTTTNKIGGDTQGARKDGADAANRTQDEVASEEVNHMEINKRTNRTDMMVGREEDKIVRTHDAYAT